MKKSMQTDEKQCARKILTSRRQRNTKDNVYDQHHKKTSRKAAYKSTPLYIKIRNRELQFMNSSVKKYSAAANGFRQVEQNQNSIVFFSVSFLFLSLYVHT